MLLPPSLGFSTSLLFSFIFNLKDYQKYGCITHISDNLLHTMASNVVHLIVSPEKEFTIADVDVWDQCPHILISARDPRGAFERYEWFLKLYGKGMTDRKYIVIFDEGQIVEFEEFFNSSALYFISDLLIIKQAIDRCELFTHKYVGMSDHNARRLIDNWYPDNNTFEYGNELFPDKLRNVYGRILNVGAAKYIPISDPVEMKGLETKFLLEFTKKFNYTLNFDKREVRLGLLFPNKTATGFTKLMIHDKIDLISYGLYIQEHRRKFGEFSYPTSEISLTCMVPKPSIINEWTVIYILRYDTWLILFFSYVILIGIFSLIIEQNRNRQNEELHDLPEATYFMIYRIIIGQPRSSFIRHNDLFLLGTFLACMIIIQTYFTSKLASFNTVPIYKDDINSLEDLAKSRIPWYTKYYDEIKTLETVKTEPLASLYKTFLNSTPEEAKVMMFASGARRFGYAINQSFNSKYYTLFDYFTLENLQDFKMVRDYLIRNQYTALFVRRNSVILPSINRYWSIVMQHGFPILWETDTINVYQGKIQQYLWSADKGNTNAHTLTMAELEGMFIIWYVGIAIAMVTFAGELIIKLSKWCSSSIDIKNALKH